MSIRSAVRAIGLSLALSLMLSGCALAVAAAEHRRVEIQPGPLSGSPGLHRRRGDELVGRPCCRPTLLQGGRRNWRSDVVSQDGRVPTQGRARARRRPRRRRGDARRPGGRAAHPADRHPLQAALTHAADSRPNAGRNAPRPRAFGHPRRVQVDHPVIGIATAVMSSFGGVVAAPLGDGREDGLDHACRRQIAGAGNHLEQARRGELLRRRRSSLRTRRRCRTRTRRRRAAAT